MGSVSRIPVASAYHGLDGFSGLSELCENSKAALPDIEASNPDILRNEILRLVSPSFHDSAEKVLMDSGSETFKRLVQIKRILEGPNESFFFTSGIQILREFGLLADSYSFGDLRGERLLDLVRMGRGNSGIAIHYGLDVLLNNRHIVGPRELTKAFFDRATWLDNLFCAAGNMSEKESWKAIDELSGLGLITRENLDDMLNFSEGSALFELAKATYKIDAGRDYFGWLFKDWLFQSGATEITSKKIGEFVRETVDGANLFYAAGKRQRERAGKSPESFPRWRNIVGNFRSILPINTAEDYGILLGIIAKALDDPMDNTLPDYIGHHKKLNITQPTKPEEISVARQYGEFLESVAQQAGLKEKWFLNPVRLTALNHFYGRFRSSPSKIMDLFKVVQEINQVSAGLGDKWFKDLNFRHLSLEGRKEGGRTIVDVSLSNLGTIYANYYLIKAKDPDSLAKYKFVWNKNSNVFDDYDPALSEVILSITWIEELFGEEASRIIIADMDMNRLSFDLNHIPPALTDLVSMEKLRNELNGPSATGPGDRYIGKYNQLLTSATIAEEGTEGGTNISIGNLVKLFSAYSQLQTLDGIDKAADLKRVDKSMALNVAQKVKRYFDNHPDVLVKGGYGYVRDLLKQMNTPLEMDMDSKHDESAGAKMLRDFSKMLQEDNGGAI